MKPARKLLSFLLVAILIFSQTAAFASAPGIFTQADLNVNTAYAGATQDEISAAFGDPLSSEEYTVPATGDTEVLWQYDGLAFTFTDGTLSMAAWENPTLIGPRGLCVGDKLTTVQSAFYMDETLSGTDIFYTAGYVETLGTELPPSAVLRRNDDETYTVTYLSPLQPYDEDVLSDPMNYVYQPHASLVFTFGAEDTVTAISWSIGALAE